MNLLLSRLDEQQRRWYVALEAQRLGRGGISQMAKISGLHPETIRRGRRELDQGLADRPRDRVRWAGGGRPKVEAKELGLKAKIESLLADETAGDPMSERKWLRRTVRYLKKRLKKAGYLLSRSTVWRLLKELGYTLQGNRKAESGPPHPDRDRQFRYIQRVKKLFAQAGHPVISVDSKKKELIGNFNNPGRRWKRQAERVKVHDFRPKGGIRAVPYGIYDLVHNRGFVYIGISADTAEFAVEALVRWWQLPDRPTFADETKLLILCDGGGSNGYRLRLWKQQLQQRLADQLGLAVMVCHYPTGASKWNPIEHRLFSYISLNWAGQPLRSLKKMLALIGDPVTETGLRVKAFLLEGEFKTKIKVSDRQMAALNLPRRKLCPNWNYMIKPRSTFS
jgi:transposase